MVEKEERRLKVTEFKVTFAGACIGYNNRCLGFSLCLQFLISIETRRGPFVTEKTDVEAKRQPIHLQNRVPKNMF